MELRPMGENVYFAASNSRRGFVSYYAECFDAPRVDHVYAVKGGPGTGKSRFLQEVAQAGEARGWKAERILCSSDPDSLDGVILSRGTRCIALLDATAPHLYEPRLPGVREELIDLGAFWDARRLAAAREEVEALNAQKRAAYRRAYRYLAAEGELGENRDALVSPYLRRGAMRASAERLLREIPDGEGYSCRTALMRSVGMRGEVLLDRFFAGEGRVTLLSDCYGAASVFLSELAQLCVKKKLAVSVSHDPVYPESIDALLLEESRRAFAVLPREMESPAGAQVLSMRRFVEVGRMKEIRGEVRLCERLARAMREGALESLRAVRAAHFALEEIYVAAMDFAAKEKFTKAFCEKLFDLQNP